jgi:modulator of FtsH protease
METNTHSFGAIPVQNDTQAQRVLRNTYALLALSMIPTAIGALIGLQFALPMMKAMGSIMTLILYFAVTWGLIYAIQRNRDNGLGVVLMLLFTFVMGAMLGPILSIALQMRNGGQLIAMAAGGTGAIFFTLAGIAATTKRDFSNMGKFLMVGLVLVLLCIVANMFMQVPAFSLAISAVMVLLFSGFILYDINRIVHGGETSYISAALNVYLDIYNLFTSLLHLLMAFAGERD